MAFWIMGVVLGVRLSVVGGHVSRVTCHVSRNDQLRYGRYVAPAALGEAQDVHCGLGLAFRAGHEDIGELGDLVAGPPGAVEEVTEAKFRE